ncbi:MAG TPA: isochorismate synthase [Acidimicrobiia bacterium]|nr:isochorismate synthase [Acidimicrobiia bacterium]
MTSMAGFGEKEVLDPGVGPNRFQRAEETGHPVVFASFAFDEKAPQSVLVVPETVVELVGGDIKTSGPSLDLSQPPPATHRQDRPRFAGSSLPDHLWLEAVGAVIGLIETGLVRKVVLARDHALWSKEPFDPYRVLQRLHLRFPECFLFLIEGLVGASPELLIRKNERQISAVTLAGTAARGDTPETDELLGKELATSEKTRVEHRLAADSVRQILSDFCSDLSAPIEPELLRLANVQHLATPISGRLDHDVHVLDLVSALHPTPAVGGVPTADALEVIASLEGMNRNRYAGPVGFFREDGNGEFAIALRCAELTGARARLFAGNGIVAGSVPEEELEETRLKLAAMLSALE